MQFYLNFWHRPSFRTHFVRKDCNSNREIVILPQFLTIEPRFVRKDCAEQIEIVILPQFLTLFLAIDPYFV